MIEVDVFPYHLFKAALDRFGRKPAELQPEERRAAEALGRASAFLEARILASEEGWAVHVPQRAARAARDEMAARYEGERAFAADLKASGLTEAMLLSALHRQLRAEAALEAVAEGAPRPSEAEIAAFYAERLDSFRTPERRRLRHILITVNPDFAENAPDAARARIEAIAARLAREPGRFAAEAATHSECPSALDGGRLGLLARGQLMVSLEAAAFALRPGSISAVVETEAGFHLALCEEVVAPRLAPLEEARAQIAEALTTARKAQMKRAWIRRISAGRAAASPVAAKEAALCAK
ncbi:MAG: nitrogen fixation protein NifM [Pseudomonadota bacterium]